MTCSFCGSKFQLKSRKLLDADSGHDEFESVICPICFTGMLNPLPSEDVLDRYYVPAYYGEGKGKFLPLVQHAFELSTRLLAKSIVRQSGRSEGRVLDIGCGQGVLLSQLSKMGFTAVGLERGIHESRQENNSLEVLSGEIWEQEFQNSSFDIAIIWHVLEHLRDPKRVLDEIYRVLKPGGLLVLAVPNNGSIQARLFRDKWFHIDAPRHLYFFGYDFLLNDLQKNGYNIEKSHTIDLLQGVYGFVQSTLNALFPGRHNRLYNLLRRKMSVKSLIEIVFWLIPAVIILPFSIMELVLSAISKTGSCAVFYARKKSD